MNISKALFVIAEQLAVPIDQVTHGAEFRRDLGADSLDMIELTLALENALDIVIADEDAARCRSVGDALAVIQRCAWENPSPA